MFPAGKIVLALSLLAPLAVAYSRLVFRARLYWPMTAAMISYNLFFVRKPYKALSAVRASPPPYLPSLITQKSLLPYWPAPYLKDWPAHFDYLLVIDAGAVPHLAHFMPNKLKLLNISHFCALFRIRHHEAQASGTNAKS